MEDILAIVLVFGGGTLFALSMSPVGRAVADRIRGSAKRGAPDAVLDQLRESHLAILDELEALRQELTDVNERVDFAEQLLARDRHVGELTPGTGQGERD